MRDRAWYGISSFEKFRSQRFESFERFVAIHDDTNYREGRKYRRENDLHGRSGLFATDYLRLWFIERSHERWRDDARNWNLSMDGPEVIAHSKYSLSADVYSFAIVLWEIVCEGHVPYPEHTPSKRRLCGTKRNTPILPYNSHPIMMNAMERCWVSEPENRPRFTDLVMDFESHTLGSATKLNLLPSKSFFSRLKSMSTLKKRDRLSNL